MRSTFPVCWGCHEIGRVIFEKSPVYFFPIKIYSGILLSPALFTGLNIFFPKEKFKCNLID
jgi:hypothetical protein